MSEYIFGDFVTATSGRDKDKIFVILKDTSEYVYLVDGLYRMISKPKKKRKKHVADLTFSDKSLIQKCESSCKIINEDIKRAIKVYKQNIKNCS